MTSEKEISDKANKYLVEVRERINSLPFEYKDASSFELGLYYGFVCGYKEKEKELE